MISQGAHRALSFPGAGDRAKTPAYVLRRAWQMKRISEVEARINAALKAWLKREVAYA